MVCKFGKGKKKTYTTFQLPRLYMLTHGVDPTAAKPSSVMLLTWTRRLLHDAGVCQVERTPFRIPYEGTKKLFLSPKQARDADRGRPTGTPADWPLAVSLLDGLGKLVDLEPERGRLVPYTAEFALHWIWSAWEAADRNVSQERAVQIVLGLRQKLIRAGLVAYRVVSARESKFRPAPVASGGVGKTASELYLHWK
jgi:hypothetical protein